MIFKEDVINNNYIIKFINLHKQEIEELLAKYPTYFLYELNLITK